MVFKNANLFGEIIDFKIEDGKFYKIGKMNEDGIDLCGKCIYPGLIDIHTHGAVGYDTMDARFKEMSDFQLKNGVTSFLPTTMTMPYEDIKKVNDTDISAYPNIIGFHMEGPYINEKYKGAQNAKFIKSPDIDEMNLLDKMLIVTIAPEKENSCDFIKNTKAKVSLGHTGCDYTTAIDAIKCGADCVTHIFNAMPPIHHREPSLIGAAIEKEIYAQVICDGIHIHKSVIKMLYKAFGPDKLILISDSMRATGLNDGEYEFGGQKITVEDGVAKTEEGAIAGSTSSLLECVKKAIEFGIKKQDAIKMATETPADYLGLNKGKIKEGFDADFIIADENINIFETYIGGKCYYKA